jgi:uncharacterized membrane protein
MAADNKNNRQEGIPMHRIIVSATATLACASAFAHGPERATRYRVEEVPPPASLAAPCLAEYRNWMQGATLNDFGAAAGTYNCYTQIDPAAGTAATAAGPFVWGSWFGSLALRDSDPATSNSFAASINNRGEVFGSDVGPGFVGVKWSLAGGLEVLFPNDEQCEVLKLDIAIAGNGRYTVGLGYRPSADLPYPLCLTPTWLTRTPSGAVVEEMPNLEPRDINVFNTAVGDWNRNTAVRFQVVTKELRILRTGDQTQQARTTDINDLGEVSGYLATVDPEVGPGGCFMLSSRALRWDRDDHETVLPLLPGATSARAWNVGTDGETVGESGPGDYCDPQNSTNERAVLWRDGRAFNLNDAIPPHLGVTLAAANSINRRGQILASGYRNADPLVICPRIQFDPQTGLPSYDVSLRCRFQRLFVLTPVGS